MQGEIENDVNILSETLEVVKFRIIIILWNQLEKNVT